MPRIFGNCGTNERWVSHPPRPYLSFATSHPWWLFAELLCELWAATWDAKWELAAPRCVQPRDGDLRQTPMTVSGTKVSVRRCLAAGAVLILGVVGGCARPGETAGRSASDLSGVKTSPVASPSASPLSVGNITGVVRMYGGPLMPDGQMADDGNPGSGFTVTATRSGKTVASMITGSAGSYSFGLPPGTYVVKGCNDATVVVVDGRVAHQDLRCDVR